MADLRLILVAAAACGAADAQPEPTSGLQAPAGWQALPAIAQAARLAVAAPGVHVDAAEAWGEPAMGCYAVWIAMHGGDAGTEELQQQILDGLAAEKITTANVAQGPTLTAEVERAPYRGSLEVRAGDGRIAALACVANDREPAACVVGCKALLGAFE